MLTSDWKKWAIVLTALMLMISAGLTACSSDINTSTELERVGPKTYSGPPPMIINTSKHYTAKIQTTLGDITVELFPEDAPQTVNNFVYLSETGYYDGSRFHRVMKGFMIQAGQPYGINSTDPGYSFDDEPVVKNYTVGTLSMANRGPNTNGSQFFINDDDLQSRLPKNYTIFGRTIEGIDVVHKIANVPVTRSPSGENSQPVDEVYIKRIDITED